MKTQMIMKSMIMAAMCVAAFTATSCDDDDDNGLRASANKVEVAPGATAKFTVSNGTQPYTAKAGDTTVAATTVSKDTVKVTGLKEGKTAVLVTDNSKQTVTVTVEVSKNAGKKLSLDKTSLSVGVGKTADVTVKDGTSPYTATVKDTKIAKASVKDKKVTVQGVAKGSTTITIADKDGKTASVAVTVK